MPAPAIVLEWDVAPWRLCVGLERPIRVQQDSGAVSMVPKALLGHADAADSLVWAEPREEEPYGVGIRRLLGAAAGSHATLLTSSMSERIHTEAQGQQEAMKDS